MSIGLPPRRLVRDLANSAGGTIGSNALAAALPFAVVATWGATHETDALFLTLSAVTFVGALLKNAIEWNAVSFTAEHRALGGRQLLGFARSITLGSSITGLLLGSLLGGPIIAVGLALAGADPEFRSSVWGLALSALILPGLLGATSTLSGIMHGLGHFGWAVWTTGLRSTTALLAILIVGRSLGVRGIAVFLALGEAVRFAILRRVLTNAVPRDHHPDGTAFSSRQFWRVAAPQFAAMTIVGINPIVDRLVASTFGGGAITTLELASKAFGVPVLVMTTGIASVVAARWSRLLYDGASSDSLQVGYQQAVLGLTAVSALLSGIGIALLKFNGFVTMTWSMVAPSDSVPILIAYLVGLPFVVMHQLGVRMLMALRHTRILPLLGLLAVALNVLLDMLGAAMFGLAGIAAASSTLAGLNAVFYFWYTNRLLRAR